MNRIYIEKNVRLAIAEHDEVLARAFEPTTISEIEKANFLTVESRIPSNFELDLLRAKKIDDPFFGTNPIKMQKWETSHLWYYTRFDAEKAGDENTFLVFEGIDTVADIYLNGEKLGHTENMFIAHGFCVPRLKALNNELIVHITPAAVYAKSLRLPAMCNGLPYNVDALGLRKSASMFGWDIMPRLVSGGIWRPTYIERRESVRVEDLYLFATDVKEDGTAQLNASFYVESGDKCLKNVVAKIEGVCGESKFCMSKRLFNANVRMYCNQKFKLWWPKNYGEQNLYDVTVTLTCGEEVLCEKKLRYGVRSVALERTSVIDLSGGKFQFYVNGKKIFIMGTNWVPLSPYHSEDAKRLSNALALLSSVGCNAVRVWGGGVYEADEFFDYCDEHGILIWQDFMMGCGIYPQTADFAAQLEQEATFIVKKLRNHPALLLWAGDNECDVFYTYGDTGFGRDPNENVLTRDVLKKVVLAEDFMRPYLPSSPYVDEVAMSSGALLPEDHLWGPRDYFKGDYYREAKAAFASEIGYHGCPSVQSLKKYISQEQLFPIVKNGAVNADWLAHAASMEVDTDTKYSYRIGLMISHVKTLFGDIPNDLEKFSLLSQISQAEAKKYFIERFRIKKWDRTGIVWWNLLDGWPQISDAVVDYYFDKKLAYYYIKRAQQPVCFIMDEPSEGKTTVFGVNDTQEDFYGKLTVRNVDTQAVLFEGETFVPKNESVAVAMVALGDKQACYCMEWESNSGVCGSNHYYANMPNVNAESYVRSLKKINYIK